MNKNLSELLGIKSTNVNLLKFICAILVIVGHANPITGTGVDILTEYTGGECSFGGLAVGVFFFFSGLYVTKSLSKTVNLRTYLAKRVERIFPQLAVVILISAFVLGPIFTSLPIGTYFLSPGTYTYLLNAVLIPIHNLPGVFEGLPYQTVNGPLWTLPVEFACYLMLWAISLILIIATKTKSQSDLSGIVGNKAFRVLLWIAGGVALIIFVTVFYVLKNEFLISVVRPIVIFIEGSLYYQYREKIKVNWIAGLIMAMILALSGLAGCFSIGMILLLPYITVALTLGIPQIKADWTVFKVSYEMYLLGWPIQQLLLLVFKGNMSAIANVLLAVPIDIVIASALYISINPLVDRLLSVRTVKKQI